MSKIQRVASGLAVDDGQAFFKTHPAADLFPKMEGGDLWALVEDVKAHGVQVPIVFYDGKVIDGRNRCAAALLAGVPPGKIPKRSLPLSVNPFEYVWSANAERRHLTPAQRSAIRIKVDEASGLLAKERAEAAKRKASHREGHVAPTVAEAVAKRADVSERTAKRVLKLEREDPEKFEALAAGEKLRPGHPLYGVDRSVKSLSPEKKREARGLPGEHEVVAAYRDFDSTAMAKVLVQRWPSSDVRALIEKLQELTGAKS